MIMFLSWNSLSAAVDFVSKNNGARESCTGVIILTTTGEFLLHCRHKHLPVYLPFCLSRLW